MKNFSRAQLHQESQDMVREYLNHPLCEISGKSWSKERLAKRHAAYAQMLDLARQARAIEEKYSVTKLDAIVLFPESHCEEDINAVAEWNHLTKAAAEIWSAQY